MKRFTVLLLSLSVVFALYACGVRPADETDPSQNVTEAPTDAPTDVPDHFETVPEGLIDEDEYRTLTNYFVTVLDEDANPVAGAVVKFSGSEATCVTDETGVAQFAAQEGEYTVSFQELPMGYEYLTESREFSFEAGSVMLKITVRQTISEPDDLGMEDENIPIEEIPVEGFVPEG